MGSALRRAIFSSKQRTSPLPANNGIIRAFPARSDAPARNRSRIGFCQCAQRWGRRTSLSSWADVGCYGSEIATPNIDALAARGIRFSHYTTHPICSPARAALLTGRKAHSVATGWLANNNPGFPGYFGDIPLDAPTIAETLLSAGYATIAVGKWHNSTNGVTPNPTWPTYRGF